MKAISVERFCGIILNIYVQDTSHLEVQKWIILYQGKPLSAPHAVPVGNFYRCKEYKVYWNMPSIHCMNYNISFTYAAQKYGFTMNKGDNFKGDKITILYNPGLFPKIYNFTSDDPTLDDLELVNSGLPQNGDLWTHLKAFREEIDEDISDRNYKGIAVIDMEHWGATWNQNFNDMTVYKILTRQEVLQQYPDATDEFIEAKAKSTYEQAATTFLYYTLEWAKSLRPLAKWGYYQYPQCFNPLGVDYCSNSTQADNDRMTFVWKSSTAVFPSLYLSTVGNASQKAKQLRGQIREGFRVMKKLNKTALNIPYITFNYYEKGVIRDEDLKISLEVPKQEGADGVAMWGASADFNSEEKCLEFKKYLDTKMGPAVKRVVQTK